MFPEEERVWFFWGCDYSDEVTVTTDPVQRRHPESVEGFEWGKASVTLI